MNTEFKGTKGEWRVDDSGHLSQGGGLCIMNGNECVAVVYNPHYPIKENAELIADAGNTIQSCGLLPSQLLKQNNEMRELLKEALTHIDDVRNRDYAPMAIRSFQDKLKSVIESTNP